MTADRVDFDLLHERYGPDLKLVRELIGVIPNCDPYLEIWPTGFQTYNLIVPNFLNLPQALLGVGGPKDMVGLGMYLSSRAASCNYCSAHTCSYALRRGSPAEAVTGASRTPAEQAVATVAEALSTVPHHYHPSMGDELRAHFSDLDAERIVLGVAMMGFLNKFMDAIGVELEQDSVDDVAALIEPTGWSVGQHAWGGASSDDAPDDGELPPVDSFGLKVRVMKAVPGAVRLENGWLKGIPKDPAEARSLLDGTYGFDEPLLEVMGPARVKRAVAAVLAHNLDPTRSELGIGLKALAGLEFARVADNDHLRRQGQNLALMYGVESAGEAVDARTTAALRVARAMAPSPAEVDADTVAEARAELSSAEIVELAVWISINQMLHRLSLYHRTA